MLQDTGDRLHRSLVVGSVVGVLLSRFCLKSALLETLCGLAFVCLELLLRPRAIWLLLARLLRARAACRRALRGDRLQPNLRSRSAGADPRRRHPAAIDCEAMEECVGGRIEGSSRAGEVVLSRLVVDGTAKAD